MTWHISTPTLTVMVLYMIWRPRMIRGKKPHWHLCCTFPRVILCTFFSLLLIYGGLGVGVLDRVLEVGWFRAYGVGRSGFVMLGFSL